MVDLVVAEQEEMVSREISMHVLLNNVIVK